MSKRNIQRVDYTNVRPVNLISSDESCHESDNDFVASLTPPKKKKKLTKKKESEAKKKNDNQVKKIKKNETSSSVQAESELILGPRQRKTRTSNADIALEQDLKTAIEISQINSHSYNDDDDDNDFEIKKNSKVIDTSHEISNEKENICETAIVNKSNGNNKFDDEKRDDDNNSDKDLNSLNEKEELPVVSSKSIVTKATPSPSKLLLKASLKKLTEPSSPAIKSKAKIPKQQTCSASSKGSIMVNSGLSTSRASVSTVEPTNTVVTPGKLRLGLSRKIKGIKPLHPNVTIN